MALRKPSTTFEVRQSVPARSLAPDIGERAIFAGQTGSGKTTAMLKLLPAYYGRRQIVIADTKNDPTIEKLAGPVATRLQDLPRIANKKVADVPLVIYRPNAVELTDLLMLDAFCEWIYRRKNTVLMVDELGQFGAGAHAGPGLTSIFARGRTAEITVLAGTQRPVSVPIIAFTESQLFFIFRLLFRRDRERLSEYSHPDLIAPPTSPYGVKVYRTGDAEPVEYVSLT